MPQRILLIGGSGFIGTMIAEKLIERGNTLLVPTRRRERARHLIVLPGCDVVEADIYDDAVLAGLVSQADAVINLVGILHGNVGQPYGSAWAKAHVELPRRIIAVCKAQGVRRYLHMSALGADSAGPSMYQRSKGDAEQLVKASGLDWTIFRPSVVFGPGDKLLNMFAKLQALFPVMPLAGADCRFAPVHVADVAEAFASSLNNKSSYGQTYELAGPDVVTLRELVQLAGRAVGYERPVLGLPGFVARIQAALMRLAPGEPLLSADNLDSMKTDNVPSGKLPGLAELGIAAQSLSSAKDYLGVGRTRARFNSLRSVARR
jgi:NADH dehydrogenase